MHRIAVRVEVDRAIGLNLANQITQLLERRPAGQGAQRLGFVGKAFLWRDARRAVLRRSATSRVYRWKCALNSAQLSNRRPAIAFFLT